ncbi:hypothetical protein BS47DRAFT_1373955 [Hydnum rufescens UP504]|uniref:methionine--tRNA ligase n=1 Tax=Hydnum rufescens UP504 TaxID=1448309 RepID=A0A9P6AJT3_9AGAM|nr:hypothetical protein BS47DRAFT_1373955 [Hydnum rufescens UP504]
MATRIRSAEGLLMHIPRKGEIVLPVDGERNILISSALPYCNNVPHLGNIIGSTLSADVFARFVTLQISLGTRTRNRKTLYVCGTDEYGTATETQALKEGITPQELCDKYHVLHAETYKWFDIGFDYFGRTSTPQHTEICQESYIQLRENGLLERQVKPQTFCEGCNKYLADRFVEGICPNCGYNDARGDQCDSCSKTLDAVDLIDPRCLVNPTHKVITRPSTHMYVKLDAVQPKLETWIKQSWKNGNWAPNSVMNAEGEIIDSRVRSGLRPSPVTRDLAWGVQVPPLDERDEDGVRGKFDAPFGYPSITANYTSEWRRWWFNPKNVQLYQFMGKDNIYFHTVFWPCILIGDGRPWTTLHAVSGTEYLQYESGKFSKSRNIGVFGPSAKETGVPPAVWRYYLLASRPETGDTTFSWNDFIAANNNVLLNNFGNFVNRVTKFVSSKFDGVIPESGEEPGVFIETDVDKLDPTFLPELNGLLKEYINSMEVIKIRHSLQTVMAISARGTNTCNEPNSLTSSKLIPLFALGALIHPFLPSTSAEILVQLNAPPRTVPTELSNDILPGHVLGKPDYLFKKIDEKSADIWRAKFGGSQAAVAATAQVEDAKPPAKKETVAAKKKKPTESDEVIELEKQIQDQRDKVRRIKAGQAQEGDETFKEALSKLQRLKLKFAAALHLTRLILVNSDFKLS